MGNHVVWKVSEGLGRYSVTEVPSEPRIPSHLTAPKLGHQKAQGSCSSTSTCQPQPQRSNASSRGALADRTAINSHVMKMKMREYSPT